MSEQPDGNEPIRVEVTANHIYGANPDNTTDWAMARALRDAGFKVVTVDLYTMLLDGREYSIDADLVQWQKDAITGPSRRTLDGMIPITMKVDREKRLVEFVQESWTDNRMEKIWANN